MTKIPTISFQTPTDSVDFHISQPGTMTISNTQVKPASFKSILKREAKAPTLKKRKKRVRMTMPKSFTGERYKPLSRNERMQKKGKSSPRININNNFLDSKTRTVTDGSNKQAKSLAEDSASIKKVAEIKENEKTVLLNKGNVSSVVECSECSVEVESPDVASPEGTPLRKILCQNCVSTLQKITGKDMQKMTQKDMKCIEKTFMSFRKDQSMTLMGKGQSSTTSYKVSDDLYKSVLKRRSARLLSQVSTIVETSETSQTKKNNSVEGKNSEVQINYADTRILDKPTATCGSLLDDAEREIKESESVKSIKAAPTTKNMNFRKDQSMKFTDKDQSSTTSYKVSDDLYKSVLKRRSARLLSQVSTIVETSQTSQTMKGNSIEEKNSEAQINDANTRILDKPNATCGSFIVDAKLEIRESESAKSIKAAPPTKKKPSSRKRKKIAETAVCHKVRTSNASVNDQVVDTKKVSSEPSKTEKNQQLEQEHSPRQHSNIEGMSNVKNNVGTKGKGRKATRKTKITFPKTRKVRSKRQTKAPEKVASQKEKTTEITADQRVTENRKRYPTRSRNNKQTVFEKDKVESKLGTNGIFVIDTASNKQSNGDAVFNKWTEIEESVETEGQNIKKNKSKAPVRKRVPQRKRRKGQEATDIEDPEIKSPDGGKYETFTKLRKRGRKNRPQISENEKEEKQRLRKNMGAAEIADNMTVVEQQESKDNGGLKKSVLHIVDVEATKEPQDKENMISRKKDDLPIIKKAGSQSSSSISDVSSVSHGTGNFNNTHLIFS